MHIIIGFVLLTLGYILLCLWPWLFKSYEWRCKHLR